MAGQDVNDKGGTNSSKKEEANSSKKEETDSSKKEETDSSKKEEVNSSKKGGTDSSKKEEANSNKNAGTDSSTKGVGKSVDEIIEELNEGKIKLNQLSGDEQMKVAEALKDKAPLEVGDDVKISIRQKNGYEDIQYKWSDGGYNYEMRWHTATPNAPEGTKPNWRVDRTKPGFAGGKDPITGEKLQGYPSIKEVLIWSENGAPYYVTQDVWKAAELAYRKGVATQEQLKLLHLGHYISN